MVVAAGRRSDVEGAAGPRTRRIELGPGEVALPGFTDAHIHLVDSAIAAESIDVFAAPTLDDALELVADAAARIPAPGWILGSGWDQRRWGVWPHADMLERVAPGRHVALRSFDLHALWASPAALAAAGIDAGSPDPPGGIYRRDAEGRPDGIMFEKASEVVLGKAPPPTPEMLRRAIRSIGRSCLELGVVGTHELGTLFPDISNGALDVYASLADAGELPVRVHAGVRADGLENALERGLRSGSRIGSADPSWLAFGWLKLFADGTLGSRTAALLEPREGSTDRGLLTNPPEFLAERTNTAAAAGIATTIHSIGDAAVRLGLDVLGPTARSASFMPRLEHVQLCHPDDRERFGRLGVAASIQPIHLREDAPGARRDWGDRAESAGYTWRSLLDAGATLALGQDAPLEPLDPWPGIALAVLRRDPTWGADAQAFGADEAISLEEALRASTVGPWQTVREPLGGRLVPGSLADLIVLPSMPDDELLRGADFGRIRPRLVLVGGAVAFER
ncbi:MAG TPA: amidohydrolase [Patescibacteria group bacterium]|nr:amidohydrolase [Patescibacteria group bacterium]